MALKKPAMLFFAFVLVCTVAFAACEGSGSVDCATYDSGSGCSADAPSFCQAVSVPNEYPERYECRGSMACADANPQQCSTIPGCQWEGQIPAGSCPLYGQACVGGQCCWGLECDSNNKCNQPSGLCSYLPSEYVQAKPTCVNNGGACTAASQCCSGNCNLSSSSCGASLFSPEGVTSTLASGGGIAGGAALTSSSNAYNVGWFQDWKMVGLIGVAIALGVIAIAAMIGRAFNLPEVKAFTDAELSQAVVSVILIASLMGLIAFFSEAAHTAIVTADLPFTCSQSGEPCYISAAKFYIDNLYTTADGYAKSELVESVHSQEVASEGVNAQFNLWWLAFAGTSYRNNAGVSISAERASAIFETTSKLMASLYAQKFFLDAIAYAIAPILLLVGIVLRTFFFTRRLGGLLLSIAIALFIIYPLAYAFAWYTLNVTIYGERSFGSPDPACPAECTARYPVAFYVGSGGKIVAFNTIQQVMQAGINASNWREGGPKDGSGGAAQFNGLAACRDLSAIGLPSYIAPNQCNNCPDYCREVPFPSSLPGCNIADCSSCNPGCKLLRQRTDCTSQCNMTQCGKDCRTQMPVENKCYDINEQPLTAPIASHNYQPANLTVSCAGCSGCPSWCRILKVLPEDGSTELLYKDEAGCKVDSCKKNACPEQCMYKTAIGASSQCDAACSYNGVVCPYFCRVNGTMFSPPDISQYDNTTPKILDICRNTLGEEGTGEASDVRMACLRCPAACQINLPPTPTQPSACAPYPDNQHVSQNCNDCPEYCRWDSYKFLFNTTIGKFTPYSVVAAAGLVVEQNDMIPYVCEQGFNGRLNCNTSSSPVACSASCDLPDAYTSVPRLCRVFARDDISHPYACRLCPAPVRLNFTYTNASGNTVYGFANLQPDLNCDNAHCNDTDCKSIPNGDGTFDTGTREFPIPYGGACQNYNSSYNYIKNRYPNGKLTFPQKCEMCPTFCRILTDDEADTPPDGLPRGLRADVCNSVKEDRNPLTCSYSAKDDCNKSNFQGGLCCSEGLQCKLGSSPTPATATAGSGGISASIALTPNYYHGSDWNYRWNIEVVVDDVYPGEWVTWKCGSEEGVVPGNIGVGGSYSSTELSNPMVVSISATGPNSTLNSKTKIHSITIDYYNQTTKKICQACDPQHLIGLGESCSNNDTAGCCGTDRIKGPLVCDNYTRTCEPKEVEIDPCFTKGFQAGGSKTDGAIPCSASCQYPAKVGIICSEYVGNGAGCEASSKNEFNFVNCKNYNQSSCASHPGCRWRDDCTGPGCGDTCTGPGACAGYPKGDESTPVEATCAGHAAEGCKWQSAASITVAIPNRESPYSQIDYCAQCPEHCRLLKDGEPLTGEFADCGIVDTESHNFVDCTKLKCPDICRVDMKTSSECGQSDPLTLQCEGCPALCRRNTGYGPDDWPSTSPPSKPDNICRIGTDYCSYSDTAYRSGCGAECRLNDSETEVCDACLECPMDCTFYPAIRSDCSEICSDESLAGPVGISPTDYIKKLPGAKGESDVKGVGSLMVPALVLPLFCIVIVIAFIRVLSPILGGDIEIPGLGRII